MVCAQFELRYAGPWKFSTSRVNMRIGLRVLRFAIAEAGVGAVPSISRPGNHALCTTLVANRTKAMNRRYTQTSLVKF